MAREESVIAARQLQLIGLTALALLACLAAGLWWRPAVGNGNYPVRTAPTPVATVVLPPPNLLRPVPADKAVAENASRGFSARPDSPAAPFRFAGDAESRARALQCLAQAVYYEAAGEGVDGERAVAQVVLNRVRSPLFPSSVCAVVYQGYGSHLDCQFTFTCDGSLLRTAPPGLWKQAQTIALRALEGGVFGQVGHSTFYHADYVLPYWADSLDKSVQIGRHIFYRLKGALGDPSGFSQRYSGHEVAPPSTSTADVVAAVEAIETADQTIVGMQADSASPQDPPPPSHPQLVADASAGVLIAGAAGQVGSAARPERPAQHDGACPNVGSTQLRPLAANDLRAKSHPSCPS